MESTGSTSASAGTSLQKSAASSGALSPATSSNVVPEMVPEAIMFQCEYCLRTFQNARARGGHLKKHRERRQARRDKMEKDLGRRLGAAGQQVRLSSSLLHVPGQRSSSYFDFHTQIFNSHYFTRSARSGSGVAPLFPGTGTSGLAPAQPSYLGTGGGGQVVGSGGHLGNLSKGNQGGAAHAIQNFPSLRSSTMPMFLSQRGGGTSGLPHPSFAYPAPAAAGGNGGTGDGVHLGRQHDMPEVNQEETTDGIDLTLRL